MEKFGATLTLALALLTASPASAQNIAPQGAVACITMAHVWSYADAVDRQEREFVESVADKVVRLLGILNDRQRTIALALMHEDANVSKQMLSGLKISPATISRETSAGMSSAGSASAVSAKLWANPPSSPDCFPNVSSKAKSSVASRSSIPRPAVSAATWA